MARDSHDGDSQCLSLGAVMALLDRELDERERMIAVPHLKSCAKCQKLARELSSAGRAVQVHLTCLDDEQLAAWVDQRLGRMRGALSKAEFHRMRDHLGKCKRCREEVNGLLAACKTDLGLLAWLRGVFTTGIWGPVQTRGLRWAGIAVASSGLIALAYLGMRGGGRPAMPGAGRPIAATPTRPSPTPEGATRVARVPPAEPAIGAGDQGLDWRRPPGAGRSVSRRAVEGSERLAPSALPGPQAALVPYDTETKTAVARASAELNRAIRSQDAAAEAWAALKLASIHHRHGDYQSAARYYRRGAAAAEKAGDAKLRVDSLILLGAALAEIPETAQARQELGLALELARKAAYGEGEQNALVQLRLLEGEAVGEGR